MDEAEKRRLKKLGKKVVETRSRALQDALDQANPMTGDFNERVRAFQTGIQREKQLRTAPPDRIPSNEVREQFVLLPVEGEGLGLGMSTWYYECPECGDVLHSVPRSTMACNYGNLVVDTETGRVGSRSIKHVRLVKLIGRG